MENVDLSPALKCLVDRAIMPQQTRVATNIIKVYNGMRMLIIPYRCYMECCYVYNLTDLIYPS